MLLKKTTYDSPEQIFGLFRNIEAGSQSTGDVAAIEITSSANVPGYDVHQPDTGEEALFAGIWTEVVAQSGRGLVQTYGFNTSTKVGLSSVVAGEPLKPVPGASYMAPLIIGNSAPGQDSDYDAMFAYAAAMAANATTATDSIDVWIRGM